MLYPLHAPLSPLITITFSNAGCEEGLNMNYSKKKKKVVMWQTCSQIDQYSSKAVACSSIYLCDVTLGNAWPASSCVLSLTPSQIFHWSRARTNHHPMYPRHQLLLCLLVIFHVCAHWGDGMTYMRVILRQVVHSVEGKIDVGAYYFPSWHSDPRFANLLSSFSFFFILINLSVPLHFPLTPCFIQSCTISWKSMEWMEPHPKC